MGKKKINSFKEYMKVALELGLGESASFTKEHWDDMVNERYQQNRNLYNYRMRDFVNESLIGKTGNEAETFNLMNRLDDVIKTETDPVKKAMAMAVRRVTFPRLERVLEAQLFASHESFKDQINKEYDVTKKASEEYEKEKTLNYCTVYGTDAAVKRHRIKEADLTLSMTPAYDNQPSDQKVFVATTLIKSFFDKEVCRDNNNRIFGETEGMKEILDLVKNEAVEISKSAAGSKSTFKAKDDTEKNDLNSLKDLCNGMSNEQKQNFNTQVSGFGTLQQYANMEITPKLTHLNLALEKNPFIDITAEEFIAKESKKNGPDGLSNSEIEWGESNIDYMLRRLYTDDELKGLSRAGIDPAEGIFVDGKPVELRHTNRFYNVKNLSMLDSAKKKCEIVSKALSGSKIDVCKFVPDGKGGYTSGNIVPVKTDLSMKTKRRSFIQWLKDLFSFKPTIKEKIKKANEETRDYQKYAVDTELPSIQKKNAVNVQVKNTFVSETKLTNKLDREFFEGAFPEVKKYDINGINNALKEAVTFTNYNGGKSQTISGLDRIGSRVNVAVLYGMTKGYSLDEILHSNDVDRKKLGRDFIEEFETMDYNKFVESKGLEKNDEARKQYNSYLHDKREHVENFCAKAYDQLKNVEIPRLDPNDHISFARNYNRLGRIGSIAADFAQAFPSLLTDHISPSDKSKAQAFNRSAAVGNKTYYDIRSMQFIGSTAQKYAEYLISDHYVNVPADMKGLTINDKHTIDCAARSKGFLNYFNKVTAGMNTFGDIINNREFNASITAMANTAASPEQTTSDNVTKCNASFYLQTENPNHELFYINADRKFMFNAGRIIHFDTQYKEILDENNKYTDEYDKLITVKGKENMSLSEAHEAQIRLDNAEKKQPEKIDFKTLAGGDGKTQKSAAPKANSAEKTAKLTGPSK